jgi:hypothetical protein
MCYVISVCILGLTMLCTLMHGLTLSKDTVSHMMLTYDPYRIVLSTCIILQLGFWAVCLYSKRSIDPDTAGWGFFSLGITTCSWVGLTTILSGDLHYAFVCIFIAFFFFDLLIMCNLTRQRCAGEVLIAGIGLLLLCIVAMIILFNNKEFYIMEHVAFISYSLVFTAFFLVHTPAEWGEEPMEYAI